MLRSFRWLVQTVGAHLDTARYFESLTAECRTLKDRVRMLIDDRHWATDGEWKESVLRSMLRRSAPASLTIARGFVVTDQAASTQIDILVYDNSYPVLYSDGDLVFVTPLAVRAIVEVKSATRSRGAFEQDIGKLASNASFIRERNGGRGLFTGYFSFANMVHEHQVLLRALNDQAQQDARRIVDHVCLGDDRFVRYWTDPPDGSASDASYRRWHAYTLANRAPGYFLHNALLAMGPTDLLGEEAWFPIESKEAGLDGDLAFTTA